MGTGLFDADVVVIGGGPGGSAAAITCASMGLRVRLLERDSFPAERPGETLHPGVESVLAQLGVASRLAAVVGSRHDGIRIRWAATSRYEAYGRDDNGPWRGYQVWRADFDAMLLGRARELGVQVFQPCAARGVLFEQGIISGVNTSQGPMTAPVVVDASGRSHWLAREMGIELHENSPPLMARYGYAEGMLAELDPSPTLVGDEAGWLWTAMVRPGLYQWARVALDGGRIPADWCPDEFRSLVPRGMSRGADVTWKLAQSVARPGWFMVGDAAAVLDPTSAKGILKALVSGITTGKLISAVVTGVTPADEVATVYNKWLSGWFDSDADQLARFYHSLGVTGFGRSYSLRGHE